ncbi:hypothetical protein [Halomonas cupida]|uniref:hypothetical protein n=1 Tax=Halomonas cupida TaxID=44933 RepID=UPI003A8EB2D2
MDFETSASWQRERDNEHGGNTSGDEYTGNKCRITKALADRAGTTVGSLSLIALFLADKRRFAHQYLDNRR